MLAHSLFPTHYTGSRVEGLLSALTDKLKGQCMLNGIIKSQLIFFLPINNYNTPSVIYFILFFLMYCCALNIKLLIIRVISSFLHEQIVMGYID